MAKRPLKEHFWGRLFSQGASRDAPQPRKSVSDSAEWPAAPGYRDIEPFGNTATRQRFGSLSSHHCTGCHNVGALWICTGQGTCILSVPTSWSWSANSSVPSATLRFRQRSTRSDIRIDRMRQSEDLRHLSCFGIEAEWPLTPTTPPGHRAVLPPT